MNVAHGDAKDLRYATPWGGVTIETLVNGKTRYELRELRGSSGDWTCTETIVVTKPNGNFQSSESREKVHASFPGDTAPGFDENDRYEEHQFAN